MRKAEPADARTISEVLAHAFADYRPLYTAAGFSATTPTAPRILDRMAEGPVWVALDRDRIVGTVSVLLRGSQCYVRGMAILPSGQGRGAGRLLLQTVEEFAIAAEATSLTLSTTPFLDRAIRLYERFGFRRSSEGPTDLFGTPLFTMTKDLR